MKRTTPLTRHIGGKVREYRLKNGWTQTELAARMQVIGCDLSREIIARIESGFRQTSVFEIDKFVEVRYHLQRPIRTIEQEKCRGRKSNFSCLCCAR